MVKTKLVEELHRIAGDGKGGFIITHGSEMQIECLVVFIESLLAEQKKELIEEVLKLYEEEMDYHEFVKLIKNL